MTDASERTTDPREDERVDRLGAVASGVCAVHCAICALLPAALGALGLGFLLGGPAEWAFTVVAVSFAGGALTLGWRRHRSRPVAVLLGLGMAGLIASRGLESGSAHGHDHPVAGDPAEGQPSVAAAGAHEANGSSRARHDAHHQGGQDQDPARHPHHDGDDPAHAAGTLIGVLAGLLLVWGHVLNIRTTRRCRNAHCA
ncbi:MAG: MerC domain-containing protein [Myxococcales bacterium FL481]|nr:MAG: MerC domain-containing protein [Myxococcales bacterium FL481]